MYQQQKRYNTAIDRFNDFDLGVNDVVINAEKNWRGVGRPQVAMHSQLPRFLVMNITTHKCHSKSVRMVPIDKACSISY